MPGLDGSDLPGFYATMPDKGPAKSSGSSIDWSSVAGAGAGLLAGAFAPSPTNPMPTIGSTQQAARDMTAQGKTLADTALSPALAYWSKLLSGNPTDLLGATTPERTRVIDQYDTARANLGTFTPRGGGTSAVTAESFNKEAGDIASLTASKRDEAAKNMAGVGTAGLSAEEAGNNLLAQTIGPLLNQEGQDTENIMKTVAGFATLAAAFI